VALGYRLADEMAGIVDDDPRVQRQTAWPYSYPPPAPKKPPPPLGEYLAGKLEPYVNEPGTAGNLARFARYQIAPERSLKPTERLLRGVKEGGDYELKEGERTDEEGNVFDAQGNKLTFKHPPQLRELADLFGDAMGPGIPKGSATIASGMRWPARGQLPPEVGPAPGFAEALAASMRRNKGGGYHPGKEITPDIRILSEKNKLLEEGLEKADKSLTSVSSLTPNDLARAARAQLMGFHTPVYHATDPVIPKHSTKEPTPEQLQLMERGAPFTELDPHRGRGALYTADKPSVPLATNAAQINPYDARVYGGVVGGPIYGETALPAGLARELPEKLGPVVDKNVADIMEGISKNPAYAPNMEAARREMQIYKERSGTPFYSDEFMGQQNRAQKTLADRLMRMYYDAGGNLIPPGEFRPPPIGGSNRGSVIPPYGEFESGRNSNLWVPGRAGDLDPRTGTHSIMQTALGNAGFSGARIADETFSLGKTIAMMDPAMVRWGGAAFKDPTGDLLSARVPASWLLPPNDERDRKVLP
jgi:hypothetical protein